MKCMPEKTRSRLLVNKRRTGGTPYYQVDPHGCWIWQGRLNWLGYGWVSWRIDGRETGSHAHRAVYVAFRGPISDDLDIDHLCRVRACVNPDHLGPVTTSVNVQRGFLARSYGA